MGHKSTSIATLLYLFAMFTASPAHAENTVLSSQNVSVQGDNLRVEIHFEQPMNYLSHFPEKKGSQLDIKLRPILTAQPGTITANVDDSLNVGTSAKNPLRDIRYEQDERGNGVLSVQFSREFDYKIESSRDKHNIDIILLNAGKEYAANQKSGQPMVNIDSGLPIYVLNLETESRTIDPDKQPILKNFRGKYDIYTAKHFTSCDWVIFIR